VRLQSREPADTTYGLVFPVTVEHPETGSLEVLDAVAEYLRSLLYLCAHASPLAASRLAYASATCSGVIGIRASEGGAPQLTASLMVWASE
jgi:hypothetical protein